MPAIQANAQSFLQNSDYPFDKVVYLHSGSFTVGASASSIESFAHNLPFTPLISGNWALTDSFNVTYEYGSGTFPSSNPGYVFDQIANVYSDATNVYISADNVAASAKTFYYRVFGFQPTDDDSDVDPITSRSSNYRLNTTYNNTKVFMSGVVDLPETTAASGEVIITHSIGYQPQVMGWIEANGYTHPSYSTNTFASTSQLTANSTQISFVIQPFNVAERAHYRIYLDP